MPDDIAFGPGYTDFSYEFGNGYQLIQLSAHEVRIAVGSSFDEKLSIPPKVIACDYDAEFLIAKQQKLDGKGNPIGGEHQYWIIEASAKKRYGPFSEAEFSLERQRLGVPETMQLKNKDSLRP